MADDGIPEAVTSPPSARAVVVTVCKEAYLALLLVFERKCSLAFPLLVEPYGTFANHCTLHEASCAKPCPRCALFILVEWE